MLKGVGSLKLALVLTLVFYLIVVITKGNINNHRVWADFYKTKQELAEQQELNRELKLKISELNKESQIEISARKKLGLVKPGEILYKVSTKE